jgi:hypothetical protein
MASIRHETFIDARPDDVWDALRDWGALHERLVPGFVTETRLDGDDRIVTFFNGAVMRELLVDCDDAARRLVWAIVDEPFRHYSASAQVIAEGGGTRFVWVADLLPDDLAPQTDELMQHGLETIKRTLERSAA